MDEHEIVRDWKTRVRLLRELAVLGPEGPLGDLANPQAVEGLRRRLDELEGDQRAPADRRTPSP